MSTTGSTVQYKFEIGARVRINELAKRDLGSWVLPQCLGTIIGQGISILNSLCYKIVWDSIEHFDYWSEIYLEPAEEGAVSSRCEYEGHTAVDTGFRKTWCKQCNVDGEMSMSGNVKWK